MKEDIQLLVIYDESRSDNKRFIRFLMKNDRNNAFCYTTMHSYVAQILLQRNKLSAADLPVLVSGEKIYTRADVVIRAVSHFNGRWKMLSLLRLLPDRLRNKTVNIILSKNQDL